MSDGCKLFRDPVHGYIEVSDDFCRKFVDTDVFQRLRFIEQSSMRMLFPSARHDRFSHSLGVYSIAKRVYAVIQGKLEDKFADNVALLTSFKETFLAAALLHDCAHSPFSHTGEKIAKIYCNDEIERKLIEEVGTPSFRADFYNNDKDVRYATHEMASAYVGCRRFGEIFGETIDKEQFARMIVGIKNKSELDSIKKAYNCLISLINGFIVDVDRLDYLQRDTWATGICNASVDVERLISGIDINLDDGWVSIKHTALSSIVNAVSARDYIFQWVITHHIVVYANEIITRAIEHLISVLAKYAKVREADVGMTIFSPDRLLPGGVQVIGDELINMPTDGDLLYLMKKYIPDDKYFQAYATRSRKHISLWKTYAEFVNIFVPGVEERYRECLGDAKFWEFFKGRLHRFCNDHRDCLCSDPQEVKVTGNQIHKIDANLEHSFAVSVLDRKSLDLSLIFKQGQRQCKYCFNAFIDCPNEFGELVDGFAIGDKPIEVITRLRKLLADSATEYAHQ